MNIACMPSKNIIHTAKVASLIGRHQEFGIETGPIVVNMAGVYARKRKMVDDLMKMQLGQYQASGAELIWGNARFTGPVYFPGRVVRRRRTDTCRGACIRKRRNP